MAKIFFLCFLLSNFLLAQNQIGLDQIPENMGKKVKICDKIYGSYITKGDSPVILLNVGADFPDNPFTLVVYQKDRKNFNYDPSEFLVGKNFCTTGKIVEFKGKPQIVLNSEKDIQLLE
jgi:hypothetical protein